MQQKDLFGSISFWGPLIMVLNYVGGMFGFDVSAIVGDSTNLANALAQVGGFVLGLIGILKRKSTIGSVAGAKNPLAP